MTIERRVRIVQDSDGCNPRKDYDCHVGRMLCWHSRYDLGDEHNYDSSDWKEELACEYDDDLADKLEELRENVWNAIYTGLCDDAGMSSSDANEIAGERTEKRCEELIDRAFDDGYIALPLTLHDHSGISMTTGYGGCPWDSGCVGIIVCTKEKAREEYGDNWENAEKYLESEVEVYDHYLRGNVWGYICEETERIWYTGKTGSTESHRWESSEEAEAWIKEQELVDYVGVAAGDYYIDETGEEDWQDVDSCWGFFGYPETMKDEVSADFADAFDSAVIEYA